MVSEKEAAEALRHVRSIALALPETSERMSHGAPSFFVRDKKLFVSVFDDHHGDDRLAMWYSAAAGVQAEVVDSDPDRFFVPPYVGHRGWIGLRLDIDPDWGEVESVVTDAYRNVAPKTLIKQLDRSIED